MELARLAQELSTMEARCRMLDARIQSDADTYRLQAEQGLPIESVLEWQARIEGQGAALAQGRRALDALTQAWVGAQRRLVEATQERKVLDRLAEKRRQERRSIVRRREQDALDETAHRRHLTGGGTV